MKVCCTCKNELPLSDFGTEKRAKDGKTSNCLACNRIKDKARYANSPEKKKAGARAYHQKNRDTVLQKAKEYAKKHPEVLRRNHDIWLEKNRATHNAWSKRWKKNNPDKVALYDMRRRHTRGIATPPWYDAEKVAAIYKERNECIEKYGEAYHVDHIIPLHGKNVCGLHVHTNLRVVTAKENLAKSNKFIKPEAIEEPLYGQVG